jgi:ribonuclease T1
MKKNARGGAAAGRGGFARLAGVLMAAAIGFGGVPGGGASAGWQSAVAREAREGSLERGAAGGTIARPQLPREAIGTLNAIAAGGPFPYAKDGTVFRNFERRLPPRPRGYYHEYTVPTPRASNRGARRIVCGGPPRRTDDCFFSDDHYNSFRRIVE